MRSVVGGLAGWLTNLQKAGWDSNKAEDRGGERFREKGRGSTFPGRAGRGEDVLCCAVE